MSQQVSQPQSLTAVSGRKGLFGDLFYVGNDNCYYCLRCKCNYRFRQDINKHVKTCGKDESAKFAHEVCGQILSSKKFERTFGQAYRHTRGYMSILQKKFFNKSKRGNHYAACIAKKKQLEDTKAAEKEATANKEGDSDGDV